VDLCVAEYDKDIVGNKYVMETLHMPDSPTEIPDDEVKSSTCTMKLQLFEGACEIESSFYWQNSEKLWKRKSSNVILDLKKAPDGTPLAKVRSIISDQCEITGITNKIIDVNYYLKYANENVSAVNSHIVNLEAELSIAKEFIYSTKNLIHDHEQTCATLNEKLVKVQGNYCNSIKIHKKTKMEKLDFFYWFT
jgi:hypothetical protein